MLEKMIGVSPPPKTGQAHESKALGPADLKDTVEAKSHYKKDFEQALKEKNAQQRKDLEKKNADAKHEQDLRADRNKKSSGGTKKKMTEVDEKMVSNGMASKESNVEIPASKEETAKIQVNQNEIKPVTEATAEAIPQKLQDEKSLTETQGDIEAQLKAAIEKNAQASGEAKAQDPDATSHLNSVEQELGDAVQYQAQSNVKMHGSADAKALAQAKSDEATAAQASNSGFEQNVLTQLKRDDSFNSSGGSHEHGSSDKRGDGGDMKADVVGNELHQAAGQSHTNFKSHIEAGAVKGTLDANAQLEGHREANINELMNQAQYLVKKGGGEMTVKMSPEGMGEVQLKVQLLNGKLSVEMQTQDHNVKKMVEDSLSDLKSGLAAHRISLEHVKINNTVAATNADNTAQMQSNLNHGGHDQRARDSFSEMQQQMNQHMQQRSQNNSGASSSAALDVAPRSIPQVSQAQALRTYGGSKGATINRVA